MGLIAARLFRKANYWNIAATPVPYWSGVNLSDYSSVPDKEMQSITDRIAWAAEKMSGGQLGIIYAKVSRILCFSCFSSAFYVSHSRQLQDDQVDLSGKDSIQIIKAMIPVPNLKSRYSSEQLQSLAADMPADSIVVIYIFFYYYLTFYHFTINKYLYVKRVLCI